MIVRIVLTSLVLAKAVSIVLKRRNASQKQEDEMPADILAESPCNSEPSDVQSAVKEHHTTEVPAQEEKDDNVIVTETSSQPKIQETAVLQNADNRLNAEAAGIKQAVDSAILKKVGDKPSSPVKAASEPFIISPTALFEALWTGTRALAKPKRTSAKTPRSGGGTDRTRNQGRTPRDQNPYAHSPRIVS